MGGQLGPAIRYPLLRGPLVQRGLVNGIEFGENCIRIGRPRGEPVMNDLIPVVNIRLY